MSHYPSFGGPSYGGAPYAAPLAMAAPASAAYPPPPPPPAGLPFPPPPPHPDAFRPWFADCLRQLSFNSRPMIQALSGEAMRQRDVGDMRAMAGIVDEIEAACLRYKLPLLYLLDSISKNVGQPYTDRLLPPVLTRLYPRIYRDVDGVTRVKMEEMVKLWRTGGAYGAELYPPGVRESVERDIFGGVPQQQPAHAHAHAPPPPAGHAGQPAQLSQAHVLGALQETLRERQEQMAFEFTTTIAKQVNVLVQIEKHLKANQASPQELADVMDKIQAIRQPHAAPTNAPQQQPQRLAAPPAPAAYPPFLAPARQPAFAPGYGGATPPLGAHHTSTPPVPHAQPVAAPAPLPALPLNVADILRNLGSTGLLSQPRTPDVPAKPSSGSEYEDMILNLGIELGAFDLNRLALPVAQFNARCKQCGLRFLNADAKLQAHMDWHFRRNRNERQSEGRGAHTRWLPSAAEWVAPAPAEAGPSSPRKAAGTLAGAAAPAGKLTAERLAALAQKWVRAPDAADTRPCPVCKEAFKSEWSEAQEEWVFMNALDVHGTIYHATCRAEQMAAAVAAKLAAADRRSASKSPAALPGALPDVAGAAVAAGAAAAAKRKAEDAEGDAKRARLGTDDGPAGAGGVDAGEAGRESAGGAGGAGVDVLGLAGVEGPRVEDVKMEAVEAV